MKNFSYILFLLLFLTLLFVFKDLFTNFYYVVSGNRQPIQLVSKAKTLKIHKLKKKIFNNKISKANMFSNNHQKTTVLNMVSSFYKSLDSNSDIATDSTVDEDIIDKNSLIYNKKSFNKTPLSEESKPLISMEDLFLPWFSFGVLFIIILILFKFCSKLIL